MTNPLEEHDAFLKTKLDFVLGRLATAMRAENWSAFGAEGLNPTQGQVLELLERRSEPLRLSLIADELAVTAASLSDSVGALERKGLLKKGRDKTDGRALAVSLTSKGMRLLKRVGDEERAMLAAVGQLREKDQIALYGLLLKLLRALQETRGMPVVRMCLTCEYFRPNAHVDSEQPHHCALVDAPFGDRLLRSDCPDHQPANAALAEQNWRAFAMND